MIFQNPFVETFFRRYPSIIVLAGLLLGIAPWCMSGSWGFQRTACAVAGVLLALAAFTDWRGVLKVLLWVVVGGLAAWHEANPSASHYSHQLSFFDQGAAIEAVVTDNEAVGPELEWLGARKLIEAQVEKVRIVPMAEWQAATGKVFIRLPKGEEGKARYGHRMRFTGAFLEPESAVVAGGFDFKRYLRCRGAAKMFAAESIEDEGAAGFPYALYAPVMKFRDASMAYLCDGVGGAEAKGFMAGVFFGCRQGVSRESTDMFIKTGTVHILSISGLHVGIIALLATWALRWLPFTARYLSLPLLIAVYVLATGASAPAMRAFLMIAVWCVHKALLYPARPINAVALAAVLILIVNPFMVNDMGFQFSFVVTGLLVLSWEMAGAWASAAFEARRWAPPGSFGWFRRLRDGIGRKLIVDVICSLVAFLSAAGLTLVYQGTFIPSTIIVNFFVLPLMFPLFALVAAKLILFPVLFGGLAVLVNDMIEKLIGLTYWLVGLGAQWGGMEHLAAPTFFGLVAFHAALLVFCLSDRKWWSLGAMAGMAALIGWWYVDGLHDHDRLIVFQGDGQRQLALALRPAYGDRAVLVDCPRRLPRVVREKLARSGVASLDYLFLTGSGVEAVGGVAGLGTWLPTSAVVVQKEFRRGQACRQAVESCVGGGAALMICEGGGSGTEAWRGDFHFKTAGGGRGYRLAWLTGGGELAVEVDESRPGERRITFGKKGGGSKSVTITNGNVLSLKELEL